MAQARKHPGMTATIITRRAHRRPRHPRPVPRHPVHAEGDRRGGQARRRRGRGHRPHPRPHARGRPGLARRDLRRDLRRGASADRCDRQLLDRRGRHSAPRSASRTSASCRPEMAALNMGSMNYAIYSAKTQGVPSRPRVRQPVQGHPVLPRSDERGGRPARDGVLRRRPHRQHRGRSSTWACSTPPYQFSLIMGVLGGIPGTTRHLVDQVDSLPAGLALAGDRHRPRAVAAGRRPRSRWAATSASASRTTSTWRKGRMAKSNGELVEKAARLCRELGRDVASPAEARGRSSDSSRAAAGAGHGRSEDRHDRGQSRAGRQRVEDHVASPATRSPRTMCS